MKTSFPSERIGDVLKLERRVVDVDPMAIYELIGVYSFGKGIFHREPTAGSDLGRYRFSWIKDGDLVLSNIQAWEGAIAVAEPNDDGCLGTHRFLTYVPADERVDTNYLRYFLLGELGMRLIRKASPGSVVRNRTLGIQAFESLTIPLPPIGLQREIASYLDRLSSRTQQLKSHQSGAAQRVSALVTALVTRDDLSDKQKREAGWRCVPLGEAMIPSDFREPVDPDGVYRIAGVYSFGRGLIDRGSISGFDTSYHSLACLARDDIVISRLGAWEGAIAVVDEKFAGAYVSPEFPTFTPRHDVLDPRYFAGIARSSWLWDAIGGSTRGSMARRKRVKAEHFLSIDAWLPPRDEQARLAALLGRAFAAEGALKRSRSLVTALEPAALNAAFATIA
jgi:type I restriction enzyme S subunit